MKDTREGSLGEFGEGHPRGAGTEHRGSDELTIPSEAQINTGEKRKAQGLRRLKPEMSSADL